MTTNNLKNLDVELPLGQLVCVTGVSGSGKSSLVMDSLYKHIALAQGTKVDNPGRIGGIEGLDKIEKIISIDQTPIGRTPRSNPATYTKVFDEIRKIFAGTKDSKHARLPAGPLQLQRQGRPLRKLSGRRPDPRGDALPARRLRDLRRLQGQALQRPDPGSGIPGQEHRGRAGHDRAPGQGLLRANHPPLLRKLTVLEEVGLEYLKLGQPATTLSGGEAQRIKISRELGKRSLPGALYILDEPTTGLHMHEVGKLIKVLRKLVDLGATVVVIEHNLDVIRAADYVLDLGPGGGENGGRIVSSGTPEEIKADPESVTGRFL